MSTSTTDAQLTGASAPPPTVRQHRSRWLTAAVAIVAVLVAGELAARALDSKLVPPLRWHSYETQRKVELMDGLKASGGADIVFVGSSSVNAGIDPAVVQARLGQDVTAFNAALSSGTPDLIAPWTLDVVIPRLHPKVVVIGLLSFDFSDTGFAFADAYRDSAGGRRAAGTDDVLDKVDWWLTDHSKLWADRFELRDPNAVLDAIRRKDPKLDAAAAALDPLGRTTFKQTQRFEDRPLGVGLQVGNWTIGTRNLNSLRRLIDGIKATGAQVVLATMPVAQEYVDRHPHGQADYDIFRAGLSQMGTNKQATVLLFDERRDHALFADEVHLNVNGAAAFSGDLAEALRPLLPPSAN